MSKEKIMDILIDCIASSRENQKIKFDVAVEMYLAYILYSKSLHTSDNVYDNYFLKDIKDIELSVKNSKDNFMNYFLCKLNADERLFRYTYFIEDSKKYTLKEIKALYTEAQYYNKQIHKSKTELYIVLSKLKNNLKNYVNILRGFKKSYFIFLNGYQDEEFSKFLIDLNLFENEYITGEKKDLFLKYYSEYLDSPTKELKQKINKLCEEINNIDKNFNFKL